MTWLEAIAFALGVINVTLVVRRSVWNYPFALAMVTLYAAVFWQARLYSDTLLQGFFLVVNIYGWVGWAANRADAGAIVVEPMSAQSRGRWAAGSVVAALCWGALMHRFTDAALPWWDAAITVASITAQVLMAQRKWENWAIWIAVDIGSIGLYLQKGLWLTALLYAVFLLLAIWGLVDWRRVMARQGTDDGIGTIPAVAA
ncbi:MAG TPA: nicotinamide riboside transporter PnuC [Sphingomonas sp.]